MKHWEQKLLKTVIGSEEAGRNKNKQKQTKKKKGTIFLFFSSPFSLCILIFEIFLDCASSVRQKYGGSEFFWCWGWKAGFALSSSQVPWSLRTRAHCPRTAPSLRRSSGSSAVERRRTHGSSSAPSLAMSASTCPDQTGHPSPRPGHGATALQDKPATPTARPRKVQSRPCGRAKATVASGAIKGGGAALTISYSRAFHWAGLGEVPPQQRATSAPWQREPPTIPPLRTAENGHSRLLSYAKLLTWR